MVCEIYLLGIEVNIEEYFLDNYTIVELVSSSIIYREYYEKDRYIFKIKNYWQPIYKLKLQSSTFGVF